ncbi:MAG TPA: DUF4010 domain-containing protein, partial [Vicinamibacteria bacterium]|nr:DUF4010 domain-containing protein [Vicinamibacteria bacterium]
MPTSLDPRLVWGLASALIIGALVGIERERSKALSGNVGIGGVRTFILFTLTGAVAAWLSQELGSPWIFVAALGSVGSLAVAGYVVQARVKPNAVGLTTETAAIGVCLLGGACTAGYNEMALAVGIAVSAVLAYKEPMHGLVAKLGPDDISAGVKLLAATFIVLPLLPATAVDPWGVLKPRSIWTLVILIAGLSLVGYVATRALGPRRGTALTGLSGGLVSSTAITLAFARQSREEGGRSDDALAGGLLLAWAVMGVRVVVIAAFVAAALVRPLVVPFLAMTIVTLSAAAFLLRRARTQEPTAAGEVALKNPFSLTAAAKFGLLFAVVLIVVAAVERYFPGRGYYVVAAIAGLPDVDAITLSMAGLARSGGIDLATAAGALVVAALANTVLKCGMVVATASAGLRRS